MRLSQRVRLKLGEWTLTGLSTVENMVHGASLNFLAADFTQNPYARFNRLRERDPLHYSIAARAWWVTGYDLVQEVLRDPRFGADVRKYERHVKRIRAAISEEQLESFENPSMLNLDPPDHSRIRRLVSQGFMNRFIQSLAPRIRDIVADCLDADGNAPIIDVIEALAKPLPAIVIAEMMGLPKSDHPRFQAWSEDLIAGSGTNEPDKIEANERANRELVEYFREIIRARRGNPGEDLIGQLIGAEEEGDKLTEMELYNTCLLLLVAGHETTTRLIGNGLYLLLSHPAQFERLERDPTLIANAVEEMLRYEPPVQATQRFAMEDMVFHGKKLKRGDVLFVALAAANRDPAAFENPDSFDLERPDVKPVSFGYGIHLCIGASLARLEARLAFEELLARYPGMQLADPEPHWGANPFFRGLERLEIRKRAPAGA